MQRVVAFVAGVIFAIGLGISGMTLPTKVIGFLDFFGDWDPSLAFVMVGAIAVYFVALRLIKDAAAPVFAPRFCPPTANKITARLIAGSAIFGVGWGLAGYCPGPAVTSLATGESFAVIFCAAMFAGMAGYRLVARV